MSSVAPDGLITGPSYLELARFAVGWSRVKRAPPGAGLSIPSLRHDAGPFAAAFQVDMEDPFIHWMTSDSRLWPLIEGLGAIVLVVLLLNAAAWLS